MPMINLMTAERNRGHMYCLMPSELHTKENIRAQAGIEPTTLGILAHYSPLLNYHLLQQQTLQTTHCSVHQHTAKWPSCSVHQHTAKWPSCSVHQHVAKWPSCSVHQHTAKCPSCSVHQHTAKCPSCSVHQHTAKCPSCTNKPRTNTVQLKPLRLKAFVLLPTDTAPGKDIKPQVTTSPQTSFLPASVSSSVHPQFTSVAQQMCWSVSAS